MTIHLSGFPMHPPPRQVRYGSLDCIVVDGGSNPTIPVILCHGYGAPGHDLAALSLEWIDELAELAGSFRFVFPAAPHDLAELGMPDGRAWWPINMARLAEMAESRSFEELNQLHPPGLEDSRDLLCEAIRDVIDPLAGTRTPLVLGGFSQGAMLTMDAAIRGPLEPPVALLQFSGTLICRDVWDASAERLVTTSVFQSHGTRDPILPYANAEALRDLLMAHGVEVDFYRFDGPHTIDRGAVQRVTTILRRIAKLGQQCEPDQRPIQINESPAKPGAKCDE